MTPTEETVPVYVITAASRHDFTRDERGIFWVRRCPGSGRGDPSGLPVLATQLRADAQFLPLLEIGRVTPGRRAGWVIRQHGGRVVLRSTTNVFEVLWRDGRLERLGVSEPLVAHDADDEEPTGDPAARSRDRSEDGERG